MPPLLYDYCVTHKKTSIVPSLWFVVPSSWFHKNQHLEAYFTIKVPIGHIWDIFGGMVTWPTLPPCCIILIECPIDRQNLELRPHGWVMWARRETWKMDAFAFWDGLDIFYGKPRSNEHLKHRMPYHGDVQGTWNICMIKGAYLLRSIPHQGWKWWFFCLIMNLSS